MPAGISATVLLVLMTYVGWWHQQRLRARFFDFVSRIDGVEETESEEDAESESEQNGHSKESLSA